MSDKDQAQAEVMGDLAALDVNDVRLFYELEEVEQ